MLMRIQTSGMLAFTMLWVTLFISPHATVAIAHSKLKLAHLQKTLSAQAQATNANAGGYDGDSTFQKINHSLKGRIPSLLKSPGRQIYDAVKDYSPSGLKRLLAKHPYDGNEYVDENGNTALTLAVLLCTRSMTRELRSKAVQCVDALLGDGVFLNVNVKNRDGDTALHVAVKDNLPVELLYKLVSRAASTEILNSDGDTPLYLAASNLNIMATAYFVIEDGQSVNAKVAAAQKARASLSGWMGGKTWLSLVKEAAERADGQDSGLTERAKALLSNYLKSITPKKPQSTPQKSDTSRGTAGRRKTSEETRKPQGKSWDHFTTPPSTSYGRPRQTAEETPAVKIYNAVKAVSPIELERLLDLYWSSPGALEGTDANGFTPIMYIIKEMAVRHTLSTKKCFDLLLKYANCNTKNKAGDTALMVAVKAQSKLAVVKAIISSGGDYEETNNAGKSILSAAAVNDDMFVYSFLRLKGAQRDAATLVMIRGWKEGSEYAHLNKFLGMQLYKDVATTDEMATLKEYMAILREEGSPGTDTGSGSSYGGTGSGSSYGGAGSGSSYGGTGSGNSYGGTGSGSSYGGTGSKSSYGGTGSGSSYGGTGSKSSYGGTGSGSSYNSYSGTGTGSHSRSTPKPTPPPAASSTSSSSFCSNQVIAREFRKAVSEGAAAVKTYYRKNALKFHPDKTASLPAADKAAGEECFKKLGQLYDDYNENN